MAKPKYYWDSSVFIALLQNEQRAAGEMESALQVVRDAESGKAVICTSVNTCIEVLGPAGDQSDVRGRFMALFERPCYQFLHPTLPVNERAAELRVALGLDGLDAIHLASALIYRVDELHTFDGDDLLRLNGNPLLGSLRICKPAPGQYGLAV